MDKYKKLLRELIDRIDAEIEALDKEIEFLECRVELVTTHRESLCDVSNNFEEQLVNLDSGEDDE